MSAEMKVSEVIASLPDMPVEMRRSHVDMPLFENVLWMKTDKLYLM
jgi:hypothetical protein